MREYTEQALVLKVGRFREADLWVRFLTPSRGVVTAFAFGGARSRRRFCGCLDELNQVRFRVKADRAGRYLTLEEGELLTSFPALRGDLGRIGLAANCIKFFEAVEIGPGGAKGAYDLLFETLACLEEEPNPSPLFPLLFRARLTFEQGLLPDLSCCQGCGEPLEHICSPVFHIEQGRLLCPFCRPGQGTLVDFSPEAARAVGQLMDTSPRDWPRLSLAPEARKQLYLLVDKFIEYHVGLTFAHGHFRKN